jgi:hypothetical protein
MGSFLTNCGEANFAVKTFKAAQLSSVRSPGPLPCESKRLQNTSKQAGAVKMSLLKKKIVMRNTD